MLPLFGNDAALIPIAAGILGFLVKYWWDFRKESARRRMEVYDKLRRDFDDEEEFSEVFSCLDAYDAAIKAKDDVAAQAADQKIRAIDWQTRQQFAAFLETVGLYAKSGVFSYELANYEFGDFTRKCWAPDSFWEDLVDVGKTKTTEPLWSLFAEFHERLAVCNARLEADPKGELKKIRI
jgi:hypothetical protein